MIVAERFGHLLSIHQQKFGVQPETREGLAGKRLRLRDFILVMRKNQVHTARVNVQRCTQVLDRHHGALDVPARPPAAHRRVPGWLAIFGGFPQREVAGVGFVVRIDVYARPRAHPAKVVVRKRAILWKTCNPVINRAVGLVREAFFREFFDRRGHLGNMLGRANHALRPLQTQRLGILQKGFFVSGGVVCQRLVVRQRVADDLVLHVGDVHDVVQTESAGVQPAPQQVVEYERAEIPDVREIVDRRTARIHAHDIVVRRDEWLNTER